MKPKTVRRTHHQVASLKVDAQQIEETHVAKPSGFARGSVVLTLDGQKNVEDLCIGDRIVTRDIGMSRLTAITPIHSDRAFRVRASVLGHGRPQSDLLVAEGQRILLRDWRAKAMFGYAEALVPVERLVDGHFIAREQATNVTFYALEFDAPHILYVEGVEVSSAVKLKVNA